MGKDDATVTSVVASGGEDDAEWWRAKRRGSAVVARVPLVCVELFSKTSPTEERREKLYQNKQEARHRRKRMDGAVRSAENTSV